MNQMMSRKIFQVLILLSLMLLSCVLGPSVTAQDERYELGKRLQRFELAWQTADPAGRKRAVLPVSTAVSLFFSLRLRDAGVSLDEALQAVRTEQPATEFQTFALSRKLILVRRVIDGKTEQLKVSLSAFYKATEIEGDQALLQLQFTGEQTGDLQTVNIPLQQARDGRSVSVVEWPADDYAVEATLIDGDQQVVVANSLLSLVEDLESRVERLKQVLDDKSHPVKSQWSPTDRATFRELLRRVESVMLGESMEIDYPCQRMLATCEAMLDHPDQCAAMLRDRASKHDQWMALVDSKKQVVVRLRAPADATQPMPVLFAFHGAGGSENMFFETYGAGRLVELARQRGWLVVAPGQSLFGMNLDTEQMLGVLENYFPIDRKRVFLVGHSMGAAQVMRQVALHPQLPRAVVTLGGGGRIAKAADLPKIPWFTGAGEFDFGKPGTKALTQSLKQADLPVQYHEYSDVEHMVIVQAALDDVFQFLDIVSHGKSD
jgi:predicted esterase